MAASKAVFVGEHQGGNDLNQLTLLERRHETGSLFHYTSAETAISYILGSATLRLSPFESLNDLWEARPKYPGFSVHPDDLAFFQPPELADAVWKEIDRHIRLHAKTACLVRDFDLPDEAWIRDAERGWAHLSQWDRYGAGHTGVCLGFDRRALVRALDELDEDGALKFHGPVRYRMEPPSMREMDIGQVRHFGVDAAALFFAEANRSQLFFSKHRDWRPESEYRLVLLNESLQPAYIPIRESLTEVYLGDAFPENRMQDLFEAIAGYPKVEVVWKLRYFNRGLHKFPASTAQTAADEAGGAPSFGDMLVPRLGGSLAERLAALRDAHHKASNLRAQAKVAHSDLAQMITASLGQLRASLSAWPQVQVDVSNSLPQAVPEAQRSRSAGMPGERVHWENGALCIVTGQAGSTPTLVASAAFQVLDGGRVRLHAVVATEPGPDGSTRKEHWRAKREVAAADAGEALAALLDQLRVQAEVLRPTFQ
ncbi:DUF2971 domain-containing protein [Streptomyces sp. NRRL S-495]|uniref:DUF2971 domain-containing protein n=1 Tax=Streptomyces sp. NRRL S-495 TaxID=1609133 RepID=UPI0005F92688|nr:DUF2971 domain-containing protein [Streptomyces sp. NRRL S-495]KJY26508.1 hypothetical protein VR45_36865 [Streptomyces sp. NRRL S-495]